MNEQQKVNFFGGSKSGKTICMTGLFAELGFLGYESTWGGSTGKGFVLIEWHVMNAADKDILGPYTQSLRKGINIFLLRSPMTSDVSKEEIERDSRILNNLNDMKVEIYTMAPNRDVPHNIIKIMERKGWLDNK